MSVGAVGPFLAAGFEEVTATSSTWCFASPDDKAWWGGMWAERILGSALAEQALATGAATEDDLRRISRGWLEWAETGDGWLSTTRLRGGTWLRAGIVNTHTTDADIDRLLDTLRRLADDDAP